MIATGSAISAFAPQAAADQVCKPRRPLPPVVARSMGPCGFEPDRLSFTGAPLQQAACLLRPVGLRARLGDPLDALPPVFAERIGGTTDLPARETLSAFLSRRDLEREFAAALWQPVARARDGDRDAPAARYLVIHDTSGPNYGGRAFPADIDTHRKINNLARFRCSDGHHAAHVIINRRGESFLGHDFAVPWRAMKFERATRFGTDLKGLFLHVELIQPRRRAPGFGRRNDSAAPDPGFTPAQYDRLALVYAVASVRAGSWLIPAFHAVIDAEMRGGHDDPQNFDLDAFAQALSRLLDRLHGREEAAPVTP